MTDLNPVYSKKERVARYNAEDMIRAKKERIARYNTDGRFVGGPQWVRIDPGFGWWRRGDERISHESGMPWPRHPSGPRIRIGPRLWLLLPTRERA